MKRFTNITYIISLSLILSSCGYQLRGSSEIVGLDNVRVISDNRTNISKILQQKFSSVNLPDITSVSKYPAIKIINITSNKRQLSVNSSGRVDEYEINKVLRYQFIFSEKNKINGTIKASASYDFNESQMQGTKEREKIAYNNIDRTLVRKLILRFKSASKSNF